MSKKINKQTGAKGAKSAKKNKKPAGRKAAAATTTKEMPVMEMFELETDKIKVMAGNRTVRLKSPRMKELIERIAATGGNIAPGIGRPHPEFPGCIELASGARRLAACIANGVKMKVLVGELTDAQMVDTRVMANQGGEDLTPIEQGCDMADMLRVHGTIREVAAIMHMDRNTVARRIELTKLVPAWVTLAESEGVTVGVAHLELVAALPEESQTRLFELFRNNTTLLAPDRYYNFKHAIVTNGITQVLKFAPWKLDDETLVPVAGACSACPKRSSCRPELFDAAMLNPDAVETRGKKAEADDTCLDGECFAGKKSAWAKQQTEKLAARLPDAKRVETAPPLHEQVKKSVPGAVPVIVKSEGCVVYVVEDSTKGADDTKKPSDMETLEDKMAGLERRRWAVVARQVRETVEVCKCPDSFKADDEPGDTLALIVGYMLAFGVTARLSAIQSLKASGASAFEDAQILGGKSVDLADIGAWSFAVMRREILKTITVQGSLSVDKNFIAHVRGAAALMGLDCDKLKAVADEEIKVPKAWAKLGEETII